MQTPPISEKVSDVYEPRNNKTGSLDGKAVIWGGKGLSVVLILVGVIGLGVAAAGFASFGGHQQWWPAGVLSQIEQIPAIAMMVAGGVVGLACLIKGAIGYVKQNRIDHEEKRIEGLKILYPEDKLHTRLEDGHHTFVLQKNGNYSLIRAQEGGLRTLRTDIPKDALIFPEDLKRPGRLEHYQCTVLLPEAADNIKNMFSKKYQNKALIDEIGRICDDNKFRLDPLKYLEPFKERVANLEILMNTGNITDRAVDYFLKSEEIMGLLGQAPPPKRQHPEYKGSWARDLNHDSDSD